jgi:hypothetical protein
MQRTSCILRKGRRVIWGRVSFFLNMHKKEYLQLFSMRCPLRQHVACLLAHIHELMCVPTCSMLVGTHTQTYVCQWARAGLEQEAPRGAQAV